MTKYDTMLHGILCKGRGIQEKMLKFFVKNTFAFLVVFLVVFSISEKGQAAALQDIPSTAATEINYLINREIITGYEDGTFKPTRNVTRAEAAIMLGKALDLNGTERATSFKDVSCRHLKLQDTYNH